MAGSGFNNSMLRTSLTNVTERDWTVLCRFERSDHSRWETRVVPRYSAVGK